EAAEHVELLVVELDLRAGRGALEAREDRLIDARRAAAPRQVVEVAETETIRVEREERDAEAGLLVRARLIEETEIRARVVERGVEVSGLRRELTEIETNDERGFRREVLDEAGQLLVHHEVRDVLAAREARVQVVEEEAVLRALADRE